MGLATEPEHQASLSAVKSAECEIKKSPVQVPTQTLASKSNISSLFSERKMEKNPFSNASIKFPKQSILNRI